MTPLEICALAPLVVAIVLLGVDPGPVAFPTRAAQAAGSGAAQTVGTGAAQTVGMAPREGGPAK